MGKIAIITDSNSGISQPEAKELGIYVVPMPFYIDGELFYEGVNLTREDLFAALDRDADVTTSQPSPSSITDVWDEALLTHDEVIHIPMSSGLSGTCATTGALAAEYGGRIHVVDNQRISVTLRLAVNDALEMVRAGLTADEITAVLMRERLEASIYITVDTLKYLQKGGRVTAAGAALGTVLGIKPILQIQGDKLDAFSKVRGMRHAKNVMLDAMENDLRERFKGKRMHLGAAYTCSDEEALEWRREIESRFPDCDVTMDPLSLSVSCHIGRGAVGIGCSKFIEY